MKLGLRVGQCGSYSVFCESTNSQSFERTFAARRLRDSGRDRLHGHVSLEILLCCDNFHYVAIAD